MDHEAFNSVLDKIDAKLNGIKSNFNLKADIERWRWDQPEVSMAWKDNDGISRNINILLESTSLRGKPYIKGIVEINAWLDKKTHGHWERFWTNKQIVNGKIEITTDEQILDAYYKVSDLREAALLNSYVMSEQAARILEKTVASPTP